MAGAALLGYLLGSVNSAVILSKLVYKKDIRLQGSGNAGMTNMQRIYGKKAALFTFLGDFCKGIVAVLLGRLLLGVFASASLHGACIAGAFAVIGHNWPLYFGFKGGKGVLTTFSVMIIIAPLPTLVAFGIFLITVILTKYVSLGSLLAAVSLPVVVFFLGDVLCTQRGLGPVFYLSLFVAVLIIARHHANIRRLLQGKESKLSLHKNKNVE
ncbi:MAG: glycerol-3-phosphate 1-O-acyltransferase PlsY [Clostridiales bacterium]|jgi:acyl-phosphate glycerol 3-phosphate acyltransferase|nr:glycerol-3-phosphate 1-O-acyltransferase PlsY [Clostridiales bacterium]